MKEDIPYASTLANRIRDYIDFRRSLGYELCSQIYILLKFDRVLQQAMPGPGPVTRDIVEKFLKSLDGLKPLTRRMQLSTVRQFLIYQGQFEPETFIPEKSLGPVNPSPRSPHIYTDEEIQALLREALRFPKRYPSRRWILYYTLIAFLLATGMRISEALALTLGDIDLRKMVVHIRKTKFHKARLVPMAPSTGEAVKHYLVVRAERGYQTTKDTHLFVSVSGGKLPYTTARNAFGKILRMANLSGIGDIPDPRIHDIRHTAAVRRLYLWYLEGKDVQSLLPVLSTYLGHSAIRCTEIYLTTTAELLEEANIRFERHFQLDTKNDGGLST